MAPVPCPDLTCMMTVTHHHLEEVGYPNYCDGRADDYDQTKTCCQLGDLYSPGDRGRGLYPKFHVERVDPAAQLRHPHCRFFVLDVDHDPYALRALEAYADACDDEYPALAVDLHALVSMVYDKRLEEKTNGQ